jgi:hypothetical protein
MGPTRAPLRALRLATAALAVLAGGCYTVTPFGSINTLATGGQNFVGGRGSQVFAASSGFLEQARKVLEVDLNATGVAQRREGDTVVFEGTDTKGHRAVVRIRPESDDTRMRVHARFGLLGDEAQTRAYLDRLAVRVAGLEDVDKAKAKPGEASPALSLQSHSADAPPGTFFQRRLEGGAREMPDP